MAILSTFYDTSAGVPASLVDEIKWSKAHPSIGSSEYGVGSGADFKVTAHPTTPYGLNVGAGKAWGHGVFDESDATITVTATAPVSTRWDLVALRRNWTPLTGGPSSVVIIEGGATEGIPAARNNNPGSLDDQPLYLVQWTPGQTQPTQLVDIRCWAGNGGLFAKSRVVLNYLTRVGTIVHFPRNAHRPAGPTFTFPERTWTPSQNLSTSYTATLELGLNDAPGWVYRDDTQDTIDITTFGPGWVPVSRGITGIVHAGSTGHRPRLRRNGNIVHMFGAVRWVNAPSTARTNLCTIPLDFRPADPSVQFIGTTITSQGIVTELLIQNGIIIASDLYKTGIANQNLSVFPLIAQWSII